MTIRDESTRTLADALEALLNRWDAEVGAMPDSRVRTVLQSCATEVRAILLDLVIARAAFAAASPEQRCDLCGAPDRYTVTEKPGDAIPIVGCGYPWHYDVSPLETPAPAAPTVEALRADLVAKLTSGWDMDPYGMYEIARADLLSDLDALEAAVRADERTRMDAPLAVDAGPEPRHMPVICCRWHAIAGQPR